MRPKRYPLCLFFSRKMKNPGPSPVAIRYIRTVQYWLRSTGSNFFTAANATAVAASESKQQQKLTTTGPLPGKYTDPPNKIIHNNNSNSNHESHGRFRIGHSRAHGRGNASLADCRGSTHRYVLLGSYFAYIVMGSVLSLTQRPTGGRVGCVVVSLNLFRSLTRYPFTSVLVMTRAFHTANMPYPCNVLPHTQQ